MRRYLLLLLMLLLTGCASAPPVTDAPPTIASLRTRAAAEVEELPMDASLDKAISSYRRLLPEVENTELAPEIMRRIADLQLEHGEVEDARDNGRDSQRIAQSYSEATTLYSQVLNDYPSSEQAERTYYQLARVYEAQGDAGNVLATLTTLVERYPQSPRIDEMQFRRGELLFSDKQFPEAVLAYAAVIDYGESSPYYEQSLYKHGWGLFKQFQYDAGLDSFLILLDRRFAGAADPRPVLEAMSRGERERIEDALRAVSLTFSYQDGATSIQEYFGKRSERPYLDLLYERLAEHYLEGERYNDAATTLEGYSQEYAMSDKAPLFLVRVIDVYERAGFANRVLGAKVAFVERYELTGEYWAARDPAALPEIIAHLKTNLNALARHHHATAQAEKSSADYDKAVKWYRTYLRDFGRDPEAPPMNFLLAEALFENRRFHEAAAEYEHTAYNYALHARNAEAGYAALLAYDEHAKTLKLEEAKAVRAQATDSALRFARAFPEHAQAPVVLTRASEELYAAGDLGRAQTAAGDVLEWPAPLPDKLRRSAWIVTAHATFDQQRFDFAETAYSEAREITPVAEPLHGELSQRLAASIYKQGESARDIGDLRVAAGHFLRVGQVVPDAKIRATSEYDAAAALIALEDWTQSVDVLQTFRQRYPDHSLQDDVTHKLAFVYLQSAQPIAAASELERIETTSQDPQERRAVLLQAADLYEQAGADRDTARTLQKFVKEFPRPVGESIEIRQRLLELSAKLGEEKARRYWLQQIVIADAKAGSERSERTRYLAAHASLALAEPYRRAYDSNKLTIPLNKSLPRKKANMENALQAYGRAADYEIAEVATEATFQIADIYHTFSQALFNSERPGNLNADELEQYEILLEEQAFPFEEQAIEVHEVNALRVIDGLYDEWVKRSFESLAALLPVRYAKQEVAEFYVDALQ
ncbi:MAG: tetratricopeptide repeat protein [Gammaproteobacteria bacterium]|nr:tetratricopeptide repeat protein [Gammaproteobacteria bacterium]